MCFVYVLRLKIIFSHSLPWHKLLATSITIPHLRHINVIFIRQLLVCSDSHYLTIVASNEGSFPYKFFIFFGIFQHNVSCLKLRASVVFILTSSNCPSTFPTLLTFLKP